MRLFAILFSCLCISSFSFAQCSNVVPAADWTCGDDPFDLELGDANDDGDVDFADVSTISGWLFIPDALSIKCWEEADVDNSGCLDLTDVILLANHLALGASLETPNFYVITNQLPPTFAVRGYCLSDSLQDDCPSTVVPGDVNGDGHIGFADLSYLFGFVADPWSRSGNPPCFEFLDVNGDKWVDMRDVDDLEAHLLTGFPIQEPHDACWVPSFP